MKALGLSPSSSAASPRSRRASPRVDRRLGKAELGRLTFRKDPAALAALEREEARLRTPAGHRCARPSAAVSAAYRACRPRGPGEARQGGRGDLRVHLHLAGEGAGHRRQHPHAQRGHERLRRASASWPRRRCPSVSGTRRCSASGRAPTTSRRSTRSAVRSRRTTGTRVVAWCSNGCSRRSASSSARTGPPVLRGEPGPPGRERRRGGAVPQHHDPGDAGRPPRLPAPHVRIDLRQAGPGRGAGGRQRRWAEMVQASARNFSTYLAQIVQAWQLLRMGVAADGLLQQRATSRRRARRRGPAIRRGVPARSRAARESLRGLARLSGPGAAPLGAAVLSFGAVGAQARRAVRHGRAHHARLRRLV